MSETFILMMYTLSIGKSLRYHTTLPNSGIISFTTVLGVTVPFEVSPSPSSPLSSALYGKSPNPGLLFIGVGVTALSLLITLPFAVNPFVGLLVMSRVRSLDEDVVLFFDSEEVVWRI